MPICAVPTCGTTHRTTDKSVSLYRFPKDNNYARVWVRCCMKKETFNTKSAFICSLHFSSEAYQRDINHDLLGFSLRKNLRKDAVPTLQLPSLGIFRKNSVEAFKTENVTSYYKAEKGCYPEEGVSLLIDLMPALSPKSFLARKMQHDFFCSRKNKYRMKFHSMNLKSPTKSSPSLVPSTDSTADSVMKTEFVISEENYNPAILAQVDVDSPERDA